MAKFSLTLLLGLCLLGQAAAEKYRVYTEPQIGRYRVDWCFALNEACGRMAADQFCQLKGFRKARDYKIEHNIGLSIIMSNRQICRHKDCDGFKWIRCV